MKLTSKRTVVTSEIFNEKLVTVHNIKETLTLHYNYIKKKYYDKAKLLFTDTDSLTYKIETEDAYKDFWSDKDKFDNSEYPEKSSYLDNQIEKLLESSKMKHQEFQLMSS